MCRLGLRQGQKQSLAVSFSDVFQCCMVLVWKKNPDSVFKIEVALCIYAFLFQIYSNLFFSEKEKSHFFSKKAY